MTFTKVASGRPSSKAVQVTLGLMVVPMDMINVVLSDRGETGMKTACPHPSHKGAGAETSQQYVCKVDPKHGPYYLGELARRKDDKDGKSVVVDAAEIKAAKVGAIPMRVLELNVHPASDIAEQCTPGEKGYLVRPSDGGARKVPESTLDRYGLLLRYLADHPEQAFVGTLRMTEASRGVYQLKVWRGQLFLQELYLPADVKVPDEVDLPVDVEAKPYRLLEELAGSMEEPFDPAAHTWDPTEALEKITEAAAAKVDIDSPPEVAFSAATLDEVLTRALAARVEADADTEVTV